MPDTIIVPLDGSELAKRALPRATALAQATQATLVLVQVLPVRAPGSAVDEATTVQAELDAIAEELRARGIATRAMVRRTYLGDVAWSIAAIADEVNAGLIVMSTHGRGGLGRWVYGSVADSLLRDTRRPVLLVPPHADRAWPTDRPLRVLVPLDGSALAEEALEEAELLAEATGAELLLLRVVEFPLYPLYGDGYAYLPFDEDAELAAAEQYLGECARQLRAVGKAVTTRVLSAHPTTAITQVARDAEVDLVVMATHGRGGIARLVLGSVATGTLQQATTPLLLVRPAVMQQPAQVSPTTAEPAGVNPLATPAHTEPPTPTIDVRLSTTDVEMIECGLKALAFTPGYEYDRAANARELLKRLEEAAHSASREPVGAV